MYKITCKGITIISNVCYITACILSQKLNKEHYNKLQFEIKAA